MTARHRLGPTGASLAATVLILLALGASQARAGGWAVSTLDPLRQVPVAGRDLSVGFTIRQHGATLISLTDTAITIHRNDGSDRVRFPAKEDTIGHYLAIVRFPTGGAWSWEVQQGWFEPQDLGTIRVRSSSPPQLARQGRRVVPLNVRVALSATTFAAAGWMLVRFLRGRHRTVTAASGLARQVSGR